ncbi:MAG TPA: CAAX prenyl protease-related protein [Pirellulales bacterium]|nr:CAAX prenyl protease-related protein [Pirellulales bacterium]
MNTPDESNPANGPAQPAVHATATGGRRALLARYPWLGFVLPLVVFLLFTQFEPTPPPIAEKPAAPEPAAVDRAGPAHGAPASASEAQGAPESDAGDETVKPSSWFGLDIPYSAYPYVYTLKIALSIAAIAFCWPTYQQFPWKLSPLAFVAGAVGVVLWVGLCQLKLEGRVLPAIGLGSLVASTQRSAFNPLVELAAQPAWAWGFLVIRFIGLALVVPLIEEFFLRGFVMRLCVSEDWPKVPFGTVNKLAVVVGTAVPLAMHMPSEYLATLVWFSMITGLMVLTRNIWDCVAAHATTNLLLGLYVVVWNQWHLM